MKYLLFQIEYRRWLLLAVLVAVALHLLPAPPGLSEEGKAVLAIVVMTVLLVIFEPVPLPVISLLIVVLEVLFQVAPTQEVAQSFMSDSVIFIAGSLMLAVAVVKQQLDKRILLFILRITRGSVHWTIFSLICFSSLLASVMGEHSVAAILLPVALILVRFSRKLEGPAEGLRGIFLMSVAYGCALAAVGTPSGGARNAIMMHYFESLVSVRLGYLEWILFMYPLVLVQIPILYVVLNRLYHPRAGILKEAFVYLAREIGHRPRLRVEDWITIWIVGFTVLLWILFSGTLGLGPIAILGVLLCIFTGVLNWEDINHDLNWGTILLYASIISLGLWMDDSGAADWIAGSMHVLLGWLHIEGGLPLIVWVIVISMLMGSLLSTGPAIAILGPIVLKQAQLMEFSPVTLGMVMVASTSFSNFTPLSSPACTIVYGSEMVRRQEFVRLGWWLAVILGLEIVLAAQWYWPFLASMV